jgi:uncharacterized protein YkwD
MSSDSKNKKLIQDLFSLHNKIRQDPKSFIPKLKKELKNYDELFWFKFGDKENSLETSEGVDAVHDAIKYLEKLKPVKELILKEELSEVANDHAIDANENNLDNSIGSDRSSPIERIKDRFETNLCGENMEFNFETAEEIVYSIIVDDGYENRDRRMNFFSPNYKFIGIGISDHPDYINLCVLDYMGDFKSIKPKKEKKKQGN